MSTVIKDLGTVTAYAYAVEQGYTGTEEEYAELMASYAMVAEEAAESAESASTSATSASASAQTATTKAGEASTSATQASASATSASQSAQTATTKASEASASASTAGTKASEASQSATTASSKASEASASATSAQTAQGLAESARDDAIDAKTDAESARDLAQQYAESIDHEKIYSAYPTDTASGDIVTFTDGADDIPMKSVVVNIEPVQSGSGDPSPDNVRPISGWTGAQVSHSGADRTNPTTYSITFPTEAGTVYGGTLDVTNGVLTVDKAMVDLGTLTWSSGFGGFISPSLKNVIVNVSSNAVVPNIISSEYKTTPYSSQSDKTISLVWHADPAYAYINYIRVKDSTYTDATAFKTAMSGVQLCYQLATPITYTLTPTEIKSLLGDNNVWADAGDTEVTYRADTKLYIERLTEPDADMIADSNIVSGSYFMVGNNLYKATANIASGAAVVVGTNCIRKSLSEALNEINA